MRKTTWLLTMSLLVMMSFFMGLEAQQQPQAKTPKLGLGLHGGYVLYSEDQFGNGFSAGLSLSYYVTKALRIELRGSYEPSTVEYDLEGIYGGDYAAMPLMLSIQYQFALTPSLKPYLSVGAGYYLSTYTLDGEDQWEAMGFTVEEKFDNVIGFHGGLGIEYFFSPSFAINLEGKYCLVKQKGTYSIADQATGLTESGDIDIDLNRIVVGAGLRIFF